MFTRTFLIAVVLLACDDAPAETSDPAATSVTPPPTEQPTAEAETTTGFIEAEIDGELKRYEYLPASENMVHTRLTKMLAQASADSEEGFELIFLGFDVRQLELPATIQGGMRDAVRGNIRAAMRMPSVKYHDAEGNMYVYIVSDESLECQSLEELRLSCTFSGTLRGDAGQIEVTEGRLSVQLGSDAMGDAITESTAGRASDEAVDYTQMQIDRRLGKMR